MKEGGGDARVTMNRKLDMGWITWIGTDWLQLVIFKEPSQQAKQDSDSGRIWAWNWQTSNIEGHSNG